jgi:hypothetical protein
MRCDFLGHGYGIKGAISSTALGKVLEVS